MTRLPADRPFVDRPVTDRACAAHLAAEQAQVWGLPPPVLIRHGMNAIYRAGEIVIRVGHGTAPASASHRLVRRLLEVGIPTVAPVDGLAADVDGFTVTGWTAIVETRRAVDWKRVGEVVRLVHSLDPQELPNEYPIVDPTRLAWWDFDAMLAGTTDRIDDAALTGLRTVVERNRRWHEAVRHGVVLCHGDLHPGNVIMSTSGELLVDWDLLALANPAWDHAMLGTYAERWGGDPAVYDSFLDGYGRPEVDVALAARLGELRNVAATLLRVRAASHDPAAAPEAAHRLAFWRGDSIEPWTAQ